MKKIFYWFLSVMLTSCTYDFDLGKAEAAKKLVLYSFPSNRDTTIISLSSSVPVGSQEKLVDGIAGANISLSVNGKQQTIYWNDKKTNSLPENCYYTIGKWNEEELVDLQAEVNGLPAIMAQTSIPERFLLEDIKLTARQGGDGAVLRFQVTFKDNPARNDFYGIRVVKKTTDYMDGDSTVLYDPVEFDLEHEPLLNNQSQLDDIFMLPNEYFQNLYIWNDQMVQGKEYTLRLDTGHQEDMDVEWNDHYVRIEYKAYLYSFSQEYYTYLKTLNDIHNNSLGEYGLSSMQQHYTNVKNGIGILGGYHITETEWIKNVELSSSTVQ